MTAFLILYVASLASKMSLSFCGEKAPYKVTSCCPFFSFIASTPDSDADGEVSFQWESPTSSTSPGNIVIGGTYLSSKPLVQLWDLELIHRVVSPSLAKMVIYDCLVQ